MPSSDVASFFDADRQKFFRPLNSSRKELIAACLRALYERLHGPAADYSHNLNREALRELISPVVREYHNALDAEAGEDEFSAEETNDPQELTLIVIRALLRDGWLEQYPDRNGLVTAFRFSRPGKLFAEAFWAMNRPSRSRQRNMRGCRNALEAALSDRGGAHDLIDAYEYAEKVIEDLTDGIDSVQERIRQLMQEAPLHTQWDAFLEFLTIFDRDYKKQLTVDSAMLNRHVIRERIEQLRENFDSNRYRRIEEELKEIAHWAVLEHTGSSVFEWLLDRIDDIVNAACESKQPAFVRAMDTYIKRIAGLVHQSMLLRTGQNKHAYLEAITNLAERDAKGQDKLLSVIGNYLSSVEVRLLDPSSFKVKATAQRNKASTISIQPHASREARLQSFLARAESEAFALSNEDLAGKLRHDLLLFKHPIYLSARATTTARDLIANMQAVEASRSAKGGDLVVRKLPRRIENEFYSGYDYEFTLKKSYEPNH